MDAPKRYCDRCWPSPAPSIGARLSPRAAARCALNCAPPFPSARQWGWSRPAASRPRAGQERLALRKSSPGSFPVLEPNPGFRRDTRPSDGGPARSPRPAPTAPERPATPRPPQAADCRPAAERARPAPAGGPVARRRLSLSRAQTRSPSYEDSRSAPGVFAAADAASGAAPDSAVAGSTGRS